jgi:hypothetical protein
VAVADYREISQSYAQGAIKAAILLNSGAAVAVLSQASELKGQGLISAVQSPMVFWMCGTAAAALAWVIAFYSTRYVDKWLEEARDGHRRTSNILMNVGAIFVVISIGLFLWGGVKMASTFGSA